MIRLFHYFVVLFVLLSCKQTNPHQINADELKELQKEGIVVIDIRTKEEYQAGHIPGVQVNIDYLKSDFLEQMKKALNKGEPVIIHCARGGRSGKATKLLREEGFTVYDYTGGFSDWKTRGEKVEK